MRAADRQIGTRSVELQEPAAPSGAFFWLTAFYVVYCARPEDWIPGLGYIPLAKIAGVFALLALLTSLGRTQRKFRDLPRESNYLLAMIGVLFMSALLSPVWKGGALKNTLDFAKVWIVWILTFLLVTDFAKLRRLIYIQSASVAVISLVSIILGHNQPRLEGVIGGIYSNSNDLAFAIVLTLPFSLAFLLTEKGALVRLCWTGAILIMGLALFMTASRAGFITLLISGTVCLWHFGVKGRRFYLIVASILVIIVLLAVAGGPLANRMAAISGRVDTQEESKAYGSYEERRYLISRAIEGIEHYPILGLGVRNFQVYSGVWHDVHMTYLQIAVEGGIPSLILYLLFLASAFRNLRKLRRRRDLDVQTTLFVGGLHSSMIGFVIGALFAPVAYQFFPFFSVAYTSALVAMIKEREPVSEPSPAGKDWRSRYGIVRASKRKSGDFTLVH
ncbi:MAG: O-antigen ligase family protein [Candidatus Sulfotelmatobacter sp.]